MGIEHNMEKMMNSKNRYVFTVDEEKIAFFRFDSSFNFTITATREKKIMVKDRKDHKFAIWVEMAAYASDNATAVKKAKFAKLKYRFASFSNNLSTSNTAPSDISQRKLMGVSKDGRLFSLRN